VQRFGETRDTHFTAGTLLAFLSRAVVTREAENRQSVGDSLECTRMVPLFMP